MSDVMSNVAMLAAPSNRSRIYLDVLERNDLLPETAICLVDSMTETAEQRRRQSEDASDDDSNDDAVLPEDPDLETNRSVRERFDDAGVPYQTVETLNPNDDAVVAAVGELDQDLLVYSGPGGVILDGDVLTVGPEFLHVHAGILPDYRGSTTVYYSLLADGQCGATAFIMNEQIDQGPVVGQQVYPPPENPETLDLYYDPWIRSRLLVDVLSQYEETGELDRRPQRTDEGETYFIVHPVLKHLTMLRVKE
ncbi:formyltransferase family protein [Natrinema halophilum]|uniref:Formyl transferase N-terminal domain-containing protein n=1 Tax=Natrinema halophilum TaxID=1699371 RepID=A0A7D5GIW6_9EURY|nr:formyltransferase family protein [Natrinema halophilum]QLG47850.1 hypothetical protein HYG82_02825 [Natrinema halophilum]